MFSFNLFVLLKFSVNVHAGQFNKYVDFHKLCFIHFVIFSFPCDNNWFS